MHLRRLAEARVALVTQSMVTALEQTLEGVVDTVDIALLASADEISRQLSAGKIDGQSITKTLIRHQKRLALVDSLRSTNEQGQIV